MSYENDHKHDPRGKFIECKNCEETEGRFYDGLCRVCSISAEERQPFSAKARQAIINCRAARGLSLEQFVEPLSVERGAIHAIESGKNNPSLDLIDEIEDAYGLDFSNL